MKALIQLCYHHPLRIVQPSYYSIKY